MNLILSYSERLVPAEVESGLWRQYQAGKSMLETRKPGGARVFFTHEVIAYWPLVAVPVPLLFVAFWVVLVVD